MSAAVVLILLLILGVAASLYGASTLVRGSASTGWPTTEAKVRRSEAVRGPRRAYYPYRAKIAYTYSVNGTQYEADEVNFGVDYSYSRSRVQRVVDRYPQGKLGVVYYHPNNPRVAVLEPGISGWSFVWLGFGVLLILSSGIFGV